MAPGSPPLAPARRSVALDPALRRHRVEAARWALAHGRPLPLDAITVILAVRRFEADAEGTPFTRWTTRGVVGFLWGSAIGWCQTREVEVPDGLTESLWTYLGFLADTGQLASGSEPVSQLREILVDTGGLTQAGRARASRGGRLATTRRLRHLRPSG